jgi:chromosome segregation protein
VKARPHWEEFSRRNGEAQRQIEVERTRIEHLERQLRKASGGWSACAGAGAVGRGGSWNSEHWPNLQSKPGTRASPRMLQRDQEQLLAQTEAELNRDAGSLAASRALSSNSVDPGADADRARPPQLRCKPCRKRRMGRTRRSCNDWLRAGTGPMRRAWPNNWRWSPAGKIAVETALADWLDALCAPIWTRPRARSPNCRNGRLTLLEPSAPSRRRNPGSRVSPLAAKVRRSVAAGRSCWRAWQICR